MVNATILFYQQLETKTNYYRLDPILLLATLTLRNKGTESNFRNLFDMLHKYCIRCLFCKEVSFTKGSFSPWTKWRNFLQFYHRGCNTRYISLMQWADRYMNKWNVNFCNLLLPVSILF